jgi:transketolase
MTVVQPCNAAETRALVRWAVERADGDVAIRLAIGPSPRRIELPDLVTDRNLVAPGRGHVLLDGDDALLVSYGPVMLHEALSAAELLRADGRRVGVVAMPWLDVVDPGWLAEIVAPHADVFVVEDHAPVGGLGDTLRRELAAAELDQGRRLHVLGVEGWPACGTPPEALAAHGLDGASIARRIVSAIP